MIAIVDYGMGNLRSVQKAIERVGGQARIVDSPRDLARAQKIVLPGVAAFGDAIAQIRQAGLDEPIIRAVRSGLPYLGFCLGLQLLFDVSYENGEYKGLGLLPGKVTKFDFGAMPSREGLKVPHIGWNQIDVVRSAPMLQGVASGSFVYFDHSYHVVPQEAEVTAATTDYGYPFVSAVWKDNIFATQFHPEKSQAVGLRILENFVRL